MRVMVQDLDLGWMDNAKCRDSDPNDFVFDPYNVRKNARSPKLDKKIQSAREFCQGCPVTLQCRDYGHKTGSIGIFGGVLMTKISTPGLIRKSRKSA